MTDSLGVPGADEKPEYNQRVEWAFAALHGDPLFGPASSDPLYVGIQSLRARLEEVERQRDALAQQIAAVRTLCGKAYNDARDIRDDILAEITEASHGS